MRLLKIPFYRIGLVILNLNIALVFEIEGQK